jgi:hypothetical protein
MSLCTEVRLPGVSREPVLRLALRGSVRRRLWSPGGSGRDSGESLQCLCRSGSDYRGMPAPAAVPAVAVPGVEVEPGARVDELRFVLEPQAAEAESDIIVIARTVRMAKVFFMAGS